MAGRLELHEELCGLLGNRKVYYNPPASVRMQYPCIKYSLSGVNHAHANDAVYRNTKRYEVIAIDPNPDSDIYEKVLAHFPMCQFDTSYVADNLNHFVLTLYY